MTFAGQADPQKPLLVHARDFWLPSERADRDIRAVLQARQAAKHGAAWIPRIRPLGSFVPYDERSTEDLRDSLKTVGEDHEELDRWYLSDKQAESLNFLLPNTADEYVDDARFEVVFPQTQGVLIADEEAPEPIYDWMGRRLSVTMGTLGYPEVSYRQGLTLISDNVGNLRHQVPTLAFATPLRVCFREKSAGSAIELKWSLFGKNLRSPLSGTLSISVDVNTTQVPDPE